MEICNVFQYETLAVYSTTVMLKRHENTMNLAAWMPRHWQKRMSFRIISYNLGWKTYD